MLLQAEWRNKHQSGISLPRVYTPGNGYAQVEETHDTGYVVESHMFFSVQSTHMYACKMNIFTH